MNKKMQLGKLTLSEFVRQIILNCTNEPDQSCDNCPLYVLGVANCIETKCDFILNLQKLTHEIEVKE